MHVYEQLIFKTDRTGSSSSLATIAEWSERQAIWYCSRKKWIDVRYENHPRTATDELRVFPETGVLPLMRASRGRTRGSLFRTRGTRIPVQGRRHCATTTMVRVREASCGPQVAARTRRIIHAARGCRSRSFVGASRTERKYLPSLDSQS